jgi:serine/threonine protein kinase
MSRTVGKFLNGGAYGDVHAYVSEGRAVKLSAVNNKDINSIQAIVREIFVLQLSNEYLVPFLSKELRYGSMELHMRLMQSDLKKIIADKDSDLSDDTIRQYTQDILHGLHFLHANDISHRDIKPDNILIDHGRAFLCDFGLSKPFCTVARKKCMTDYMVTRWYRAPEVCRKQGYNNTVDTWAVGCIVYEMCIRRPMFYLPKDFTDDDLNSFIARVPEKLRRIEDASIRELVGGLLLVDPLSRWTAKRALQFMDVEAPVYTKAYYTGSIISDVKWKNKFKEYLTLFPSLTRVIMHALMLFERSFMQEDDFKIAMAISYMIFETFPSREGFIDKLGLKQDRKRYTLGDVTYKKMARWVCDHMRGPTMFHEYEKTKDVESILDGMCPSAASDDGPIAKRQKIV